MDYKFKTQPYKHQLDALEKSWKPYADIELQGPGVKKIISYGTRVGMDMKE